MRAQAIAGPDPEGLPGLLGGLAHASSSFGGDLWFSYHFPEDALVGSLLICHFVTRDADVGACPGDPSVYVLPVNVAGGGFGLAFDPPSGGVLCIG